MCGWEVQGFSEEGGLEVYISLVMVVNSDSVRALPMWLVILMWGLGLSLCLDSA